MSGADGGGGATVRERGMGGNGIGLEAAGVIPGRPSVYGTEGGGGTSACATSERRVQSTRRCMGARGSSVEGGGG